MKTLKIIDNELTIIDEIASFLGVSGENAQRIFEILASDKYPYKDTELIVFQKNSDDKGILFMDGLYFLNIKTTVLVVLALLLDMNVTSGLASATLQLMGLGNQGIAKLNSYLGERCIAREATLMKEIDKEVLSANHMECVNNDLECKFRKENRCNCMVKDVEKIIDSLEHKNVLKFNDKSGKYRLPL